MELWVRAQEVKVAGFAAGGFLYALGGVEGARGFGDARRAAGVTAGGACAAAVGLGGGFEEVDGGVAFG